MISSMYLGRRHGADGADEPLLLKLLHELQESRSLLAQAVCLRNPAVGEVELRRVLAVPADLLDLFPLLEAGGSGLDEEEIDGGMGIVLAGIAGGQDQEVAVDPVADEGLLAVEDDLVAVLHGRGLDRGQVAPGVGFRHGDRRDDVAGDAAGEVFVLLLLGGEGDDVGDDDVAVERGGEPRVVRPDHLLGDDDGIEEIRPQAAVLLGDAHAEEALLAHLLPGLPGDDPRLLPLLDVGDDFLIKKLP